MSPPRADFDPYRTLGLTPQASQEEIRAAYKRLAKLYHPDGRGADKDKDEAFRRVTEAWRLLGDPALRQAYDQARRRIADSHPPASLGYELGSLLKDLWDAGRKAKENFLAELESDEPQGYPDDSEDVERDP